jgi:hypothetical protein
MRPKLDIWTRTDIRYVGKRLAGIEPREIRAPGDNGLDDTNGLVGVR